MVEPHPHAPIALYIIVSDYTKTPFHTAMLVVDCSKEEMKALKCNPLALIVNAWLHAAAELPRFSVHCSKLGGQNTTE